MQTVLFALNQSTSIKLYRCHRKNMELIPVKGSDCVRKFSWAFDGNFPDSIELQEQYCANDSRNGV